MFEQVVNFSVSAVRAIFRRIQKKHVNLNLHLTFRQREKCHISDSIQMHMFDHV